MAQGYPRSQRMASIHQSINSSIFTRAMFRPRWRERNWSFFVRAKKAQDARWAGGECHSVFTAVDFIRVPYRIGIFRSVSVSIFWYLQILQCPVQLSSVLDLSFFPPPPGLRRPSCSRCLVTPYTIPHLGAASILPPQPPRAIDSTPPSSTMVINRPAGSDALHVCGEGYSPHPSSTLPPS